MSPVLPPIHRMLGTDGVELGSLQKSCRACHEKLKSDAAKYLHFCIKRPSNSMALGADRKVEGCAKRLDERAAGCWAPALAILHATQDRPSASRVLSIFKTKTGTAPSQPVTALLIQCQSLLVRLGKVRPSKFSSVALCSSIEAVGHTRQEMEPRLQAASVGHRRKDAKLRI